MNNAPRPQTFLAALDFLSTLAPHRVRAAPPGGGEWPKNLDLPAPLEYKFRNARGEWGDALHAALSELEREYGLVVQVQRSTASVYRGTGKLPLVVAEGINALQARTIALALALADDLERAAQQ